MSEQVEIKVFKAGEKSLAIEYSDNPGVFAPLSAIFKAMLSSEGFLEVLVTSKSVFAFCDLETTLEETEATSLELLDVYSVEIEND